MKVYHVSKDIFEEIRIFTPQIPEYIIAGEDNTIERVCVAHSVVDCINGLSYDRNLRTNLFSDTNDCFELLNGYNRAMKVYEFEVDNKYIEESHHIKAYVPDALETKECWVRKNIVPTDSYIINITDVEFKENSNILSKVIYEIVDEEDFFKKCEIEIQDNDEYDEILDACSSINVKLSHSGNIIELDLKEFPILKEGMKGAIENYLCWSKTNINFY